VLTMLTPNTMTLFYWQERGSILKNKQQTMFKPTWYFDFRPAWIQMDF
jgi:hypothetical protein